MVHTRATATHTRFTTGLALAIGAAALALASAARAQPEDHLAAWDIVRSQCVKCHGPAKQQGGLRLDSRDQALRGGKSRKAILGKSAADSEIFRRVTSAEPKQQMPPGDKVDALSLEQQAAIKAWLDAGAPWFPVRPGGAGEPQHGGLHPIPTELPPPPPAPKRTLYGRKPPEDFRDFVSQNAYAAALMALLIPLYVVHTASQNRRAYRAAQAGKPAPQGVLDRLGPGGFLLAAGAIAVGGYIAAMQEDRQLLVKDIDLLDAKIDGREKYIHHLQTGYLKMESELYTNFDRLYGNPPMPVRPSVPVRLHGVYYRGNDERNPRLYNGGVYRTATIDLGLYDENRKPLNVGDKAGGKTLWVWLHVVRSPHTTSTLFTKDILDSFFLSEQAVGTTVKQRRVEPVRFTVLKEDWEWEAWYPLPMPASEGEQKASGLVYLYSGEYNKTSISRTSGYFMGIKYELAFKDGAVQEGSDLWLGNLFRLENLQHTAPGRVHVSEWLDYRELPLIAKPNPNDPKLLGVDTYFKQAVDPRSLPPEPNPELTPKPGPGK